MATRIYIDKENGDTGMVTASKDLLRPLPAPSKIFVEKSHPKTPLVGRTANVNLRNVNSQSVRKALGNLNKPLSATKLGPIEKKLSAKKAIKSTNKVEGCSMIPEDCPEKENFFPCDPLDFESFEVPEEHRLSHMSLTGVPLMMFEKASNQFTSIVSAPRNQPLMSWDNDNLSDTLQSTKDFLFTLDDIIIDLPSPLQY
ncbi:securin [Anolis carolinensis]|uniref:Securin n=1 Tax=Anolis carolinensis TaxID=28377 RepID=A0A803TDN6_ANOCA|nr:PREDICTED: securin [Anolis carolinensis]|eukprot:XP_003225252.1 PREDICTED: securin [Anolis carolinensis]